MFVCPLCSESESDVNAKTNLPRCFHCERNFNPIEFRMAAQMDDFKEAVEFLKSAARVTA
jgi:transposase-like protein